MVYIGEREDVTRLLSALGAEFEAGAVEVDLEVKPWFPIRALALAQGVIELDKFLFERGDDSGHSSGAENR